MGKEVNTNVHSVVAPFDALLKIIHRRRKATDQQKVHTRNWFVETFRKYFDQAAEILLKKSITSICELYTKTCQVTSISQSKLEMDLMYGMKESWSDPKKPKKDMDREQYVVEFCKYYIDKINSAILDKQAELVTKPELLKQKIEKFNRPYLRYLKRKAKT